MKNLKFLIPLLFMLFSANSAFSQIETFQFEGPKTYPNGTIIAYFHIVGITDTEEANYIQRELIGDEKINRFFIYEKTPNGNRCMIEATSDVNEEYIKTLINKYIIEFKNK